MPDEGTIARGGGGGDGDGGGGGSGDDAVNGDGGLGPGLLGLEGLEPQQLRRVREVVDAAMREASLRHRRRSADDGDDDDDDDDRAGRGVGRGEKVGGAPNSNRLSAPSPTVDLDRGEPPRGSAPADGDADAEADGRGGGTAGAEDGGVAGAPADRDRDRGRDDDDPPDPPESDLLRCALDAFVDSVELHRSAEADYERAKRDLFRVQRRLEERRHHAVTCSAAVQVAETRLMLARALVGGGAGGGGGGGGGGGEGTDGPRRPRPRREEFQFGPLSSTSARNAWSSIASLSAAALPTKPGGVETQRQVDEAHRFNARRILAEGRGPVGTTTTAAAGGGGGGRASAGGAPLTADGNDDPPGLAPDPLAAGADGVSDEWRRYLQQVSDFKSRYGHTQVPPFSALGRWVVRQRADYRAYRYGTYVGDPTVAPPVSSAKIGMLVDAGFRFRCVNEEGTDSTAPAAGEERGGRDGREGAPSAAPAAATAASAKTASAAAGSRSPPRRKRRRKGGGAAASSQAEDGDGDGETNQSFEERLGGFRMYTGEQFTIVNRNVQRLALQAPRQRVVARATTDANGEDGNNFNDLIPELCPHPRSLYVLWQEYMYGIEGRKPAKDFTSSERGKSRHKYCRRKLVWDTIARLIRAGYNDATAIDRIYQCYGRNLTVTQIIGAMKRDKRTGGHPNLRV